MKAPAYSLDLITARPRSIGSTLAHQFRYDLRAHLRNRQSLFFTLALPVMFLLIFASVFGHGKVVVGGFSMSVAAYYVPGIMVMGIVSASFNNLASSVIGTREAGIYKRRRATPVSAVALIASRALVALVTSLLTAAVLLAVGYGYGVAIPVRNLPVLFLDVVVATMAFGCLAYALASVVRSRDAVTPAVMAITLPLYFISGVFVPSTEIPHWLLDIAGVFPVRHLASALLAVYNPQALRAGLLWGDSLVIGGWGVFGLVVAVRRFAWLPRSH